MASYLITGVSRGLGFEFLRQLSNNPANTIIGLVRNKDATAKKITEQLPGRHNIHLVQADLTDYVALQKAVEETAAITGGALDYVIANAGWVSSWSGYLPIGKLGSQPEKLEENLLDLFKINVVGQIHLFNLTLPLVLKGRVKKVIAISSGLADVDVTAKYDLADSAPYSISKAALNMAVAKFSAQYAEEGVLFMTISPGTVDVGHNDNITEEEKQALIAEVGKYMKYAPHWRGQSPIDVAVGQMISVMERSSIQSGDGGSSVSHFGNKQWL